MKSIKKSNMTNKELDKKLDKLKEILKNMDTVAIGFSGGVDSTFLIKIAHEMLNERVVAVTIFSPLIPKTEFNETKLFSKSLGVKHVIIKEDDILDSYAFKKNPPDRCYYCKKSEFGEIIRYAKKENINFVADGSNIDDLKDYRPGRRALAELNVRSPLFEAGLSKLEIRRLSRIYNLPTWNKPAMACLASRIPYKTKISNIKLRRIELAEEYLKKLGFKQIRVRDYGDTARIEVDDNFDIFSNKDSRNKISARLHKLGYDYITLDIDGYKKGSMNKGIKKKYE